MFNLNFKHLKKIS